MSGFNLALRRRAPVDPEFLAEARERTPGFAKAFADNIGAGATRLTSAACPKGCGDCRRECAVRWIVFSQWEKMWLEEEAALIAEHDRPTLQ